MTDTEKLEAIGRLLSGICFCVGCMMTRKQRMSERVSVAYNLAKGNPLSDHYQSIIKEVAPS